MTNDKIALQELPEQSSDAGLLRSHTEPREVAEARRHLRCSGSRTASPRWSP
jgi:hypothetical protein